MDIFQLISEKTDKDIMDLEVIKEFKEGTLVLATLGHFKDKRAFMVTDKSAKSISVATICKLIKDENKDN